MVIVLLAWCLALCVGAAGASGGRTPRPDADVLSSAGRRDAPLRDSAFAALAGRQPGGAGGTAARAADSGLLQVATRARTSSIALSSTGPGVASTEGGAVEAGQQPGPLAGWSWDTYHSHEAMVWWLHQLVALSGGRCRLEMVGTSVEGRPLLAVVVGDDGGGAAAGSGNSTASSDASGNVASGSNATRSSGSSASGGTSGGGNGTSSTSTTTTRNSTTATRPGTGGSSGGNSTSASADGAPPPGGSSTGRRKLRQHPRQQRREGQQQGQGPERRHGGRRSLLQEGGGGGPGTAGGGAVGPPKPSFTWIGNMHGDETANRELLLRLLAVLCASDVAAAAAAAGAAGGDTPAAAPPPPGAVAPAPPPVYGSTAPPVGITNSAAYGGQVAGPTNGTAAEANVAAEVAVEAPAVVGMSGPAEPPEAQQQQQQPQQPQQPQALSEVAQWVALAEGMVVRVLPSMNPDGFTRLSRYNGNGVDLNRNFWDDTFPYAKPGAADARASDTVYAWAMSGNYSLQPEAAAVAAWLRAAPPDLSANLHGGALVVNYPLDACDSLGLNTSCPTQDEPLPHLLALAYAAKHTVLSADGAVLAAAAAGAKAAATAGALKAAARTGRGQAVGQAATGTGEGGAKPSRAGGRRERSDALPDAAAPPPAAAAAADGREDVAAEGGGAFPDGTTQGAAWYTVLGSLQDWVYHALGRVQLTLELHAVKNPPASELPALWAANRRAMLRLMQMSYMALRTTVVDADEPARRLAANLTVVSPPGVRGTGTGAAGYLYKPLAPNVSYSFVIQPYDPLRPGVSYEPVPVRVRGRAGGWDEVVDGEGTDGLVRAGVPSVVAGVRVPRSTSVKRKRRHAR